MRNHSADFLMYERRTRMAGREGKMSVIEIILQLDIIKNSIKRICNQKEVYKLRTYFLEQIFCKDANLVYFKLFETSAAMHC